MIELLMLMTLTPLSAPAAMTASGPFQTCVWPNPCSKVETVTAAKYEICLWPRKCSGKKAPIQVAQLEPCVWPDKCSSRGAPGLV